MCVLGEPGDSAASDSSVSVACVSRPRAHPLGGLEHHYENRNGDTRCVHHRPWAPLAREARDGRGRGRADWPPSPDCGPGAGPVPVPPCSPSPFRLTEPPAFGSAFTVPSSSCQV